VTESTTCDHRCRLIWADPGGVPRFDPAPHPHPQLPPVSCEGVSVVSSVGDGPGL